MWSPVWCILPNDRLMSAMHNHLMINGRYDYFFPLESSRNPMFRFRGTENNKRQAIFDAGHIPPHETHPSSRPDDQRRSRLARTLTGTGEMIFGCSTTHCDAREY
jgi:hypothetical protein